MSGNPLYFIIESNNYKSCNLIGPYHILGIGNLTGAPDCFAGGGGGVARRSSLGVGLHVTFQEND